MCLPVLPVLRVEFLSTALLMEFPSAIAKYSLSQELTGNWLCMCIGRMWIGITFSVRPSQFPMDISTCIIPCSIYEEKKCLLWSAYCRELCYQTLEQVQLMLTHPCIVLHTCIALTHTLHTHTHTHTHTHYTHTHTTHQAPPHTHIHIYCIISPHTYMYMYAHTHINTHICHAHTHRHTHTHKITHLTYRVGEGSLLCFPSQVGQWDHSGSEQSWTGMGNRRSFRT